MCISCSHHFVQIHFDINISDFLGADKIEVEEEYVCLKEWVLSTAVPHCSTQSLQAAMQLVNIQTLAFTPPHTLPWRVYLYTHTQHEPSGNTPHCTLILGELLYTGEASQRTVVNKGMCEGDLLRKEGGEKEVKVTLIQQPRDDKALKGFLSILTTVLYTLSSEKN